MIRAAHYFGNITGSHAGNVPGKIINKIRRVGVQASALNLRTTLTCLYITKAETLTGVGFFILALKQKSDELNNPSLLKLCLKVFIVYRF